MDIETKLVECRQLWKNGDASAALAVLRDPSLSAVSAAHFLSGEINYSCQEFGAALNHFRRCLSIEPQFPGAQAYVDLILNILGFFHTDQFNP